MLRNLVCTLTVGLVCLGMLQADEIKGKVKSNDAEKSTVTVTVADKDQTVDVAKDAKITRLVGKKLKKAQPEDVPGGLTGLTAGADVTITTEKKDGKDVATAIRLEGLFPKKKKNQ